jgi:hypothetical protein
MPGDECGEVDDLPTTVVGDEGEEGRRNGDARGELKDNGEGLYAEAYAVCQPWRSTGSRRILLPCPTIVMVCLMNSQQTKGSTGLKTFDAGLGRPLLCFAIELLQHS